MAMPGGDGVIHSPSSVAGQGVEELLARDALLEELDVAGELGLGLLGAEAALVGPGGGGMHVLPCQGELCPLELVVELEVEGAVFVDPGGSDKGPGGIALGARCWKKSNVVSGTLRVGIGHRVSLSVVAVLAVYVWRKSVLLLKPEAAFAEGPPSAKHGWKPQKQKP